MDQIRNSTRDTCPEGYIEPFSRSLSNNNDKAPEPIRQPEVGVTPQATGIGVEDDLNLDSPFTDSVFNSVLPDRSSKTKLKYTKVIIKGVLVVLAFTFLHLLHRIIIRVPQLGVLLFGTIALGLLLLYYVSINKNNFNKTISKQVQSIKKFRQ